MIINTRITRFSQFVRSLNRFPGIFREYIWGFSYNFSQEFLPGLFSRFLEKFFIRNCLYRSFQYCSQSPSNCRLVFPEYLSRFFFGNFLQESSQSCWWDFFRRLISDFSESFFSEVHYMWYAVFLLCLSQDFYRCSSQDFSGCFLKDLSGRFSHDFLQNFSTDFCSRIFQAYLRDLQRFQMTFFP